MTLGSEEKLILFLSVDVIDSTKLKHKPLDSDDLNDLKKWRYFYFDFYSKFHTILRGEYDKQITRFNEQERIEKGKDFSFWKSLGDELLFKIEIRNHMDCFDVCRAFVNSLQIC